MSKYGGRFQIMTNEANKGIYATLREINVNEHTEQKGNLTYLSWVWALDQLYLHYPQAEVIVHKNRDGWPYWTDGRTCWVDVEIQIPDESMVATETAGAVNFDNRERVTTRREYAYPIMNYQNKSIPLEKVTSFDVNTSIQRAVTRCIARFGLGFYIYAGEDLPPEENAERAAALLKEWEEVDGALMRAGVDRHDQKVIDWVSAQVKVELDTLNPTDLLTAPELMKKVMAALKKAAKAKTK